MPVEHRVLADETFGLLGQPFQVIVFAQGEPVLTHIDSRLLPAFPAFHVRSLSGMTHVE